MAELASRSGRGRRISQASGILLLGLGIFLLLSLASYSEQDYPNSSRSLAEGRNWGGRIGAYLSYGAFAGFGYAAYVLPLLALLWGWNRLRQQPVAGMVCRTLGLLGMALIFSAGSGLPNYSPHTAFRLGGWLGIESSRFLLIPYGGRLGSSIILGALFIAALILTTELRLKSLLRAFALGWRPFRWLGGLLVHFRVSWQEREALDQEPEEDEWEEEGIGPRLEIGPFSSARGRGWNPVPEMDSAPEPESKRVSQGVLPGRGAPAGAMSRQTQEPVLASPRSGKGRFGSRYRLPSVELLDPVPSDRGEIDQEVLMANARLLEEALRDFDVAGRVVEVKPGPVVTRYEVEPAPGVKVNQIVTLADDLARIMSAKGIRIQAPVPGKSVVGIELANQHRQAVYLREILESKVFRGAESKLTVALGKTISGEPFVADLAKMPHLLVAGATGAGKSVCINGMICSLLLKATPEEVRFLMVDPKVVELTIYRGIPHLLAPVITDPKQASEALKWAVAEMEARYQRLANLGVRHLVDYNRKLERLQSAGESAALSERPMPYLVIVIDEFADLMLSAPADVETSLMSLAQKSRAVGIHLVLATQRPSVNVITGVVKANFPSRIAFQVASKTDSRTILDVNGAERLLGRGDMLFLPGGQGEPIRIHGAYVSGEETERLVEAIRDTGYVAEEVAVFADRVDIKSGRESQDPLFDEAVRLVVEHQQASTSFLQRRMKVGYARAARLMDELESAGIVGPAEGAKPRQILIPAEELGEFSDEGVSAD